MARSLNGMRCELKGHLLLVHRLYNAQDSNGSEVRPVVKIRRPFIVSWINHLHENSGRAFS
jgi:hypothetical protein